MDREEKIALAHILTHPVRYRIAEKLETDKQLFITQLAKEFGLDRKVVAFHVRILEKNKLVATDLEMDRSPRGNPVVIRNVKLTELGRQIMSQCKL